MNKLDFSIIWCGSHFENVSNKTINVLKATSENAFHEILVIIYDNAN